MSEIADFAVIILVVAAGLLGAVVVSKISSIVPIPGPAIFLVAAAVLSDVFAGLDVLSVEEASRIAVVALVIILFDGGMHIGWRRFRTSAVEITVLGIFGTFGTALLIALFAHWALGFSWTLAAVIGAALAPTDPAVMFSVLGKREIGGRSGTILEGESGFNDPVGISLMIGALEFATHDDATFLPVAGEFAVEMVLGLGLGLLGGVVLSEAMRRISLPSEPLYPIFALAFAGVLYGATTLVHGSGFLAVFAAGIVFGDDRAPYKGEVERFHMSLASIAEIGAFVALGLTISFDDLAADNAWLDGLLLALVLAFVARPLVVGLLVLPARLRWGERLFVMWGGLKGAVPILLGTLVLLEGVDSGTEIYGIVFVVVAFSVIVQGTSIPFVAPWLGVPMRPADAGGVYRVTVRESARASGTAIRDLPLSERTWVQSVARGGELVPARGRTVLLPGDEVELILDVSDVERLERLFGDGRS